MTRIIPVFLVPLAITYLNANVAEAGDGPPEYAPVTDERLLHPEPENWLQWRGNYAGWTYSALEQINSANVKDLVPVWSYSTGSNEGHESPAVVNGAYMFVTNPNHEVIALDARTGYEIWRYRKEVPDELFQMHPTNRGVALYADMLYFTATDACVVALEAETGEEVWETCPADWSQGLYMTLAPLAVRGKILVGMSGAEFGVRCFIAALDAETGKELWRTYTIPGPGEPGHETWPGDTWKHGGGSVWVTATYDPDLDLAFFGVGNPGPWNPDVRPGDNLYTNSVLAIDIDTGTIKAHHQYHWNGAWDWDEVSPPLLIDFEREGKTVKGLVHAGRNGYLWILERGKGQIRFVDAAPYVHQTAFKSIDPETGRPTYDEATRPGIGKTAFFCPAIWGGKAWEPEAYNPKTGLFYIPANNNICGEWSAHESEYRRGQLYIGTPIPEVMEHFRLQPGALEGKNAHIGEIQAWDLSKGKKIWTYNMRWMNWGPILTTAGNLVFSGGSNDRVFRALDATTGKRLWSMRLNSGVIGVPSSYMIDGIQFIAVQAGWGVDAAVSQEILNIATGLETKVPPGGVVWVFALKGR
jgi:alcohol dehydrogenase (cytochrome c)